jgi:23S rRNA A1618 N6-methylase RlmF
LEQPFERKHNNGALLTADSLLLFSFTSPHDLVRSSAQKYAFVSYLVSILLLLSSYITGNVYDDGQTTHVFIVIFVVKWWAPPHYSRLDGFLWIVLSLPVNTFCTMSKRKRDSPVNTVSFEALITPNFEELSRQFPAFGRAYHSVQASQKTKGGPLSAHVTQDFTIALTKALLHVHFGIALPHIPDDRLCPPVPNRYFMVRWVGTELLPLLASTQHFEDHRGRAAESFTGLDIGTGASCIYPLLFLASMPSTKIYATDIDSLSVELSRANVQVNRFQSSIQVLQVPPSTQQQRQINTKETLADRGPLWQSLLAIATAAPAFGITLQPRLDFCITNPPFYDSNQPSEESQYTAMRTGDGRQRTHMTAHEGSYPGGEVGFVSDTLFDCLQLFLQQRVESIPGWTCCMCGKKESWIRLKHIVTEALGPAHVVATEFGPGHWTRWFLAWTFLRPKLDSPLAVVSEEPWQYDVSIDLRETPQPMDAVLERMKMYFDTLSGLETTCRFGREGNTSDYYFTAIEKSPSTEWTRNEALPDDISGCLSDMSSAQRLALLPLQGHFAICVKLTLGSGPSNRTVQLSVKAFCHSSYGKKVIERLRNHMPGEITRTNRRWRRILERDEKCRHTGVSEMDER